MLGCVLVSVGVCVVLWRDHLSGYMGSGQMSYNNVVGYGIFLCYWVQYMSGVCLGTYYVSGSGFNSVQYMMCSVNVG